MSDAEKKAFDFAQETTKQLLTLATAIFALTITFIREIANTTRAEEALAWLHWGWGLYVASIAFGVMTLLTLTGNLVRPHGGDTPTIYGGNIRVMAGLQILSFAAALVLTAVFGIEAI